MKKNSKGMTLTELLIVVSIIVFLVTLIVFFLRQQVFKGNDARRKADLHKIQIAIEEYEKDHDCYPSTDLTICNPGTGLQPYIDKIPCDPITKASYFIEIPDSVCPFWYRIYTVLENQSDVDIEEVGCTYGCGPVYAYNYYLSSANAPSPPSGTSPSPGSSSTPLPDEDQFYGCLSGVCTSISWDPERPGPECDPNYQNPTCYGQCSDLTKECQPWGE